MTTETTKTTKTFTFQQAAHDLAHEIFEQMQDSDLVDYNEDGWREGIEAMIAKSFTPDGVCYADLHPAPEFGDVINVLTPLVAQWQLDNQRGVAQQ